MKVLLDESNLARLVKNNSVRLDESNLARFFKNNLVRFLIMFKTF
jgi:hypothetical protein